MAGTWYDDPGIVMLCEVAQQLAALGRSQADRIASLVEQLGDADQADEGLVDELAHLVRSAREDTAIDGLAHIGDFLVMLDMTSMAHGLKPNDAGPGPVAEAGWALQQQAPVRVAAKQAGEEVLDGTGPGDLTAYRAAITDNPPPPAPGMRHLKAVDENEDEG